MKLETLLFVWIVNARRGKYRNSDNTIGLLSYHVGVVVPLFRRILIGQCYISLILHIHYLLRRAERAVPTAAAAAKKQVFYEEIKPAPILLTNSLCGRFMLDTLFQL